MASLLEELAPEEASECLTGVADYVIVTSLPPRIRVQVDSAWTPIHGLRGSDIHLHTQPRFPANSLANFSRIVRLFL